MTIESLHTDDELEAALEQPRAVLYKHSPRCGISVRTMREVETFAEQHPEVSVYLIDVVAEPDLSASVAQRFDILHQSPQTILLRDGQPVWHASHFQISARRLEKELR